MLAFPDLPTESLEIESFLEIKSIKIDINEITTLIGPQASGKSIIAKLLYFFRKYVADLFRNVVPSEEGRPAFNKRKIDELFEIFGGAKEQVGTFRLCYRSGSIEVSVMKEGKDKTPKIRLSKELTSLFTKSKNDYKRFIEELDRSDVDEDFFSSRDFFDYSRSTRERMTFFRAIPSTLFIPASRAFFSVIRDEVFTLLTAQGTLDPLMAQFGRIYSVSKRHFDRDMPSSRHRPSTKQVSQDALGSIIGGKYFRKASKDYIETEWGIVELPNSSSGQQEALPLVLSLLEYPSAFRANDLVIIEEPEAHLFPRAQKEIMHLIAHSAVQNKSKVLFTTHSPYMIACLNNELARNRALEVSAYYLCDGGASSIVDEEDGLVDMQALDAVSEEIASDFLKAMNE